MWSLDMCGGPASYYKSVPEWQADIATTRRECLLACSPCPCVLVPLPPSHTTSLQVDVEGYEPGVLRGAKRLLLEHTVQHIFMEYSPGVPGKQ